jgi:hypothetical protein
MNPRRYMLVAPFIYLCTARANQLAIGESVVCWNKNKRLANTMFVSEDAILLHGNI